MGQDDASMVSRRKEDCVPREPRWDHPAEDRFPRWERRPERLPRTRLREPRRLASRWCRSPRLPLHVHATAPSPPSTRRADDHARRQPAGKVANLRARGWRIDPVPEFRWSSNSRVALRAAEGAQPPCRGRRSPWGPRVADRERMAASVPVHGRRGFPDPRPERARLPAPVRPAEDGPPRHGRGPVPQVLADLLFGPDPRPRPLHGWRPRPAMSRHRGPRDGRRDEEDGEGRRLPRIPRRRPLAPEDGESDYVERAAARLVETILARRVTHRLERIALRSHSMTSGSACVPIVPIRIVFPRSGPSPPEM